MYLIATFPSRKYNIDDYPAVKEYLLSFGYDRLKQTGDKGSRKKTNNKWFETQDSISYWDDFFKQKIVWGNLCLKSQFAIAENDMFVNAPSPMIVPGNKYILAVLNSPVGDWYIRSLGVTRNGGYFEYKPMFVEKVPVPKIEKNQYKQFEDLVDTITLIDNNLDINQVEQAINRLIYNLFQLSNDEIDYLESNL